MAVKDWEIVQPPTGVDRVPGTVIVRWPKTGETFGAGDTGKPFVCGHVPDKSVHVDQPGTSTVTMQGSNQGTLAPTLYGTLNDPSGTPLSFTGSGSAVRQILENTDQVRPVATGGDPSSCVVYLHLNSSARR